MDVHGWKCILGLKMCKLKIRLFWGRLQPLTQQLPRCSTTGEIPQRIIKWSSPARQYRKDRGNDTSLLQRWSITFNGEELKRVEYFHYLESIIASSESDIKRRRTVAWVAFWKLSKIWNSNRFPTQLKLNVLRISCLSILLYAVNQGCLHQSWKTTSTTMPQTAAEYYKDFAIRTESPMWQSTRWQISNLSTFFSYLWKVNHRNIINEIQRKQNKTNKTKQNKTKNKNKNKNKTKQNKTKTNKETNKNIWNIVHCYFKRIIYIIAIRRRIYYIMEPETKYWFYLERTSLLHKKCEACSMVDVQNCMRTVFAGEFIT